MMRYWLGVFSMLALVGFSHAETQLLAVGKIPGDAADRSGLTGKLDDGTPRNRLGSLGSGIAYTGKNDRYLMISDRGPKDGATDFPCRWHEVRIVVTTNPKPSVQIELHATTLLKDAKGQLISGSTKAIDPTKPLRFDPEAIRLSPTGTIFLADEYGPHVREFDATGKQLRELTIPKQFHLLKPSAQFEEEMPPHNLVGRAPNRGFEGLAISPDGKKLFALLQSPLIQDGAFGLKGVRTGLHCRLVEIDLATSTTREYVVPMENPEAKLGEILAINDHEFLVLEGDSTLGKDAKLKTIVHIDIKDATDVSNVEKLPASKLPTTIRPVAKKLFLNFLDPKFKLAGPQFPAKIEGLAFGPDLHDGRRLLLVATDNDFLPEFPLEIFAFAIDAKDLPNYQPQRLSK